MSKAVLGERIWLNRKAEPIRSDHQHMAWVLSVVAALGMPLLGWGLWAFDLGITLSGLVLTVGAKLWFLDRMVWIKESHDP